MPVLVASHDFIKGKWGEADDLIGKRDKSDIPLVALALAIEGNDGIWSTDNDFDVVRGRFKVWKTRELLKA
jgi:predicted nucleic acid-binding protein